MKILMIINPKSGKANARAKLLDALNVFSQYEHSVEVYVTQKAKDAYYKASECGMNYDLVIACGGDGTLNEVTSGLMRLENKPLVGYFPSGTMNDFASNFQLTNNWKETAQRICTGKSHFFDVGEFNDKYYFNYVAAFGAMCDVPYATPQDIKNQLGNLAYLLEGVSKLPEIHPIPLKVKTKDTSEEFKALFGLILSGNRAAGVELLDKEKGKMDDGIFNIIIVEYADSILNANYLSILTSQPSKLYHWYRSDKVELEFEDMDIIWTLDGEKAIGDQKVTIRNIHNALKIVS